MCLKVLPVFTSEPHVYAVPARARRGHQIPLELELQMVWTVAQALGIQPGSFARAVSAPKSWAISPALTFSFFIPRFFFSTISPSPFKGRFSLLFLTQLPYLLWQGTGVWMGVAPARWTPSQASGLLTRQFTTLQGWWPSLSLISFSSPEISHFKWKPFSWSIWRQIWVFVRDTKANRILMVLSNISPVLPI